MKRLILICGTGRSGTSFFCRTIAEAIGDVDESSFRKLIMREEQCRRWSVFSIISKAQRDHRIMGINDLPVDAFFSNVLYKNLTVYLESIFEKRDTYVLKDPRSVFFVGT